MLVSKVIIQIKAYNKARHDQVFLFGKDFDLFRS